MNNILTNLTATASGLPLKFIAMTAITNGASVVFTIQEETQQDNYSSNLTIKGETRSSTMPSLDVSEFYMQDRKNSIYKITAENDGTDSYILKATRMSDVTPNTASLFGIFSRMYFYTNKGQIVYLEVNPETQQVEPKVPDNITVSVTLRGDILATPETLDWYPYAVAYPLNMRVVVASNIDPQLFVYQAAGGGLDLNQGDMFTKIAKCEDMYTLGIQATDTSPFYRSDNVSLTMPSPEDVAKLKEDILTDIERLLKNWVYINIDPCLAKKLNNITVKRTTSVDRESKTTEINITATAN